MGGMWKIRLIQGKLSAMRFVSLRSVYRVHLMPLFSAWHGERLLFISLFASDIGCVSSRKSARSSVSTAEFRGRSRHSLLRPVFLDRSPALIGKC